VGAGTLPSKVDHDDAVMLFAWKMDSPMTLEYLHCVLSTDQERDYEEILCYYPQRWMIECFFRQAKDQLKLDGCHIRHIRAVKRYWVVVLLACLLVQHRRIPFSTLRLRKGYMGVESIDDATNQEILIDVIKRQLHVA
jgi:hypothetical protein